MAALPLGNKISQESTRELNQKVIVSNYGDGYQQRAALGLHSRFDTWSLVWNALDATERATFMSFFETHGLVISWDWTPPNGVAGKYVFTSAPQERSNGHIYGVAVTAMQVFE